MVDKEKRKDSELRGYIDVPMTVSKHRNRYGCDKCKKDVPTEAFIGFCGNILWICEKCFNKLSKNK